MNGVILTTKEELTNLIKDCFRKILKEEKDTFQPLAEPKLEIVFLKEASEITGLAIPTIYAKTSKGEIPFYKKSKKLYFKRSELLQWIENGKSGENA